MSDNKSTHWSITINNPTPDEYAQIDQARAKGWKVDGQVEKGAEGTPHLQLLVKTPHIRFGAVKKQFPRAHIEAARNPAALAAYVKKEGTRVAELPGTNEMYPGMNAYFHRVTRVLLTPDKEGIDVVAFADGEVLMYRTGEQPDGERLLELLDSATRELVRFGFHVEHYAVNPAVRSSWKKFGCEMLLRADAEIRAEHAAAAAAAADLVRSVLEDRNAAVVHTPDAISEVQVPVQAPPRDPPSPSSDGSQAP